MPSYFVNAYLIMMFPLTEYDKFAGLFKSLHEGVVNV